MSDFVDTTGDGGTPNWDYESEVPAAVSDQTIGLVLAISSSVFIGSSFIVKKRGLRIAGSTGVRAGTLLSLHGMLRMYHSETIYLLCLQAWVVSHI